MTLDDKHKSEGNNFHRDHPACVTPSWSPTADMPVEWVAMKLATQNELSSGSLERRIAVPP